MSSLFDGIQNLSNRKVAEYEKLGELAKAMKGMELRVVATIGTFDLVHIGHARFLGEAKKRGDVLIVGADSDRAVRIYKKDDTRPMVPEDERIQMLLHLRYADFATLVDDVDEDGIWQMGLIKAVRPSVFVAVEDSYPPEQLEEMKQFCDDIVVLGRQAETSTSEQIRKTTIARNRSTADQLRELADRLDRGES